MDQSEDLDSDASTVIRGEEGTEKYKKGRGKGGDKRRAQRRSQSSTSSEASTQLEHDSETQPILGNKFFQSGRCSPRTTFREGEKKWLDEKWWRCRWNMTVRGL